jgi:hypothetical protein
VIDYKANRTVKLLERCKLSRDDSGKCKAIFREKMGLADIMDCETLCFRERDLDVFFRS